MADTDKNIVLKRFSKSFETYNRHAVVQQQIVSELADLLLYIEDVRFERVLEIGCGTGLLTQKILSNYSVGEYVLNDLADSAFEEIKHIIANQNFNNFKFIPGDAEQLNFPENFNVVISSSSFHWFNNLENFFLRMHTLLNNEGVIAFSTYGKDNFNEVKTISNIGLNYKTLPELISLLEPNFDVIKTKEWNHKEQFESPNAVLKHMKLTGVNGLDKSFFGKEKYKLFNEKYCKLFSNEDKSVNLTYHPIIIIARKKKNERN